MPFVHLRARSLGALLAKVRRIFWRTIPTIFIVATVGLVITSSGSAEDIGLSKLQGLWAQVDPQGEPVRFVPLGVERLEGTGLSFVAGPAIVMISSGEFGSDVRISGAGSFVCYYKYLPFKGEAAFQWLYRGGNEACPRSAVFRQVDLPSDQRGTSTKALAPSVDPIITSPRQSSTAREISILDNLNSRQRAEYVEVFVEGERVGVVDLNGQKPSQMLRFKVVRPVVNYYLKGRTEEWGRRGDDLTTIYRTGSGTLNTTYADRFTFEVSGDRIWLKAID